jgi:ferredoxin
MMLLPLVVCSTFLLAPSKTFAPVARAYNARLFHDPLFSSSFPVNANVNDRTIALSLPKPLGLVLEEVEKDKSSGVFVIGFGEEGSALEFADLVKGATLVSVQGERVQSLDFDSVLEKIASAPETVDLEFLKPATSFEEGTQVAITVLQKGKDDWTLSAKVGDNLRKLLLDNGVEVYQGMKQTLGNCGGAGQCTFCAMDFITSKGWAERSEYEDNKLRKFPNARLSCLNNIQGPATLQKSQR